MSNLLLSNTVEQWDNVTATYYKVNVDFKLISGAVTTITDIAVIEERNEDNEFVNMDISVTHTNEDEDIALELYSDNAQAFESLISFILGMEVCFTESGMQDDTIASLELS